MPANSPPFSSNKYRLPIPPVFYYYFSTTRLLRKWLV
jgi:hypothetical protein